MSPKNRAASVVVAVMLAASFAQPAEAAIPQWGNPNVDINNVNFGRITSATGNRNFALSTRFEF